jgi:hypothetical protein
MAPGGFAAVAAGKILERLGYRFDKHVTDSAFRLDAVSVDGTITPLPMIGTTGGDQQTCRFRDAQLLAIKSQGGPLSPQKWQPTQLAEEDPKCLLTGG